MAIISGTQQVYGQIGIREDLEDAIYNISPIDTPFINMVGRTPVQNTYHEWQTDSLANVDSANAQIEGDQFSYSAPAVTTRVGNYTQILRKTASVSNTYEQVNKAGRTSEMAYQLSKRTKELARDMETIMLNNQGGGAGSSGAARTLRGLPSWYATNTSRGSGGANGSAGSGATDAGSTRALTEALLKPVLKACWDNGGMPDTIMVGSANKQVMSGFSVSNTRFQNVEDKKLTAVIDIYEGDFGTYKIVANRFQRARDLHVLQPDMLKIGVLRPLKVIDVATTADAMQKALVTEVTLIVKNEAANGVVADLA